MLLGAVDLTTASEKGNLIGIVVVLGRISDVVLHAPHPVEGCFLVEIVDKEDLATIDLHAVPSESVYDEERLVRVSLNPLRELCSRLEDFLVSWGVIEEILVIFAII